LIINTKLWLHFFCRNEKEGIPVELINQLDVCVEIPQQGIIRSLNVHVSGALLIWEYRRQQLVNGDSTNWDFWSVWLRLSLDDLQNGITGSPEKKFPNSALTVANRQRYLLWWMITGCQKKI
jgi:hypothetical protein